MKEYTVEIGPKRSKKALLSPVLTGHEMAI